MEMNNDKKELQKESEVDGIIDITGLPDEILEHDKASQIWEGQFPVKDTTREHLQKILDTEDHFEEVRLVNTITISEDGVETGVKCSAPGIYYEKSPNQYLNEKGELDLAYWHRENPRNHVMVYARMSVGPREPNKLVLMWSVADQISRGMRRFYSQKDAEEYIRKMFVIYKFHWMKPECVDR